MRQELTDKIWEIADQVARTASLEVVDIEFLGGGKHRVLRVFIDKDGGVTCSYCEAISICISDIVDTSDLIPGG